MLPEDDIYRRDHKKKLMICLNLIRFHVWDDGTPIKKFKRPL